MNRKKVIEDSILVTRDSIYLLQRWLGLLEQWREAGLAETDQFIEACRQLREAGLEPWVRQAGGHGLDALAKAVGVEEVQLNSRYRERAQR